ncbi:hypothetical protein C2G38_2138516 [Gigaspora rosea]|uniref:Uncharacterized protein n=1 Tax=Gigaspora rosea TaxID=44941 RepID=A0A397VY83_9GLOM|nr:hypothetical protein C2G38_2138516 [Gigaspora rosea]
MESKVTRDILKIICSLPRVNPSQFFLKTHFTLDIGRYCSSDYVQLSSDFKSVLTEQLKDHFKSEHKHTENELERIRQEVESARIEAVIYQAQLGSATNIRWSDDTLNYPIQLTKEIEKLCRKIDDFAKVKGKCYAINEKSALCLLEKYESKTCTVDKGFKLLLSFALQRMVLELIFNAADKLYKSSEWLKYYTDDHLY